MSGYNVLMAGELKVGDLVRVGPRYVMADHPPFIGRGHLEPDEHTGSTWRVCALRKGGHVVALAPAYVTEPDESDEELEIVLRRLSRAA